MPHWSKASLTLLHGWLVVGSALRAEGERDTAAAAIFSPLGGTGVMMGGREVPNQSVPPGAKWVGAAAERDEDA